MAKRRAVRIAVMVALCAATAVPCSWDTTPAFSFRVRPDDPESYINGSLGIIGKEFARSHLVVAYRWLSGNPPAATEREGFLSLIGHRLKRFAAEERPATAWEKARAEIRGVQPGSAPWEDRSGSDYGYFTNCNDDAFLKAVEVLRDRVSRFGAKSAAVASWLDAQETVFENCHDGEDVPKPAEPSLPPLLRADRAYQIAAANFYAMKYDDARAQFLAIAGDSGSPWRQTARIVAARALLRKATVPVRSENDGGYVFDDEPMQQAERDLRAILADKSMAAVHDQARQLLRFAAFRLHPQERFAEAAKALLKGSASAPEARSNLDEYTLLFDREDVEKGKDDLTQWIETIQSGGNAIDKWRATKKPHWLVAALASASEKDAAELLEASGKIGADSAAYPMIAHHRARLLLASNKTDEARAELDRVLEQKLPESSRNLLLEQRRSVARSLADFIRDSQATPVGYDADQTEEKFTYPLLPEDAAKLLSEATPLDLLADAAMTKDLAKEIRNPILIAAWTRAILLDREDVAKRLAPSVIAIAPDVEKHYDAWLKAGAEQRRFAAADLVVHNGGLLPVIYAYGGRLATDTDLESVNHGGGNWWCFYGAEPLKSVPPFLAGTNIANERLALMELGSGPTFLLQAFLDLADAAPKDPRVPEGLSLAVKGTRWACGDAETDKLAERAFNLLHKRYASTTWAKETPYWYKSGY